VLSDSDLKVRCNNCRQDRGDHIRRHGQEYCPEGYDTFDPVKICVVKHAPLATLGDALAEVKATNATRLRLNGGGASMARKTDET
jgi:hypothetical protein